MASTHLTEPPVTPPRTANPQSHLLTPPLTGGFDDFAGRLRSTEHDAQSASIEPSPTREPFSSSESFAEKLASTEQSSEKGELQRLCKQVGGVQGWRAHYYASDSEEERQLRLSAKAKYTNYKSFIKDHAYKFNSDASPEKLPYAQPTANYPDDSVVRNFDSVLDTVTPVNIPSKDTTFNFMAFPLEVRQRIYALTLTVPALVCVRQNRTMEYNEQKAYIFSERRELLPGIAFVLCQPEVDSFKSRFSSFSLINVRILRVNKAIYSEAKSIMYGSNTFEIVNLNRESSPPVAFDIPLFPKTYPRLIRKIVIRANSAYGFQYMIKEAGYGKLKNFYRGLENLTLILELRSTETGYGRRLSRQSSEGWIPYVKRVHNILQLELFDCEGIFKSIPTWVDMRVLFLGESYMEALDENNDDYLMQNISTKQRHIKSVVAEAFELFKKGGR